MDVLRVANLGREPVVGLKYLVPCIRDYKSSRETILLAVRGAKHSDPEIGFSREHYHYDLRFFSDEEIREIASSNSALAGEAYSVFIHELAEKLMHFVSQNTSARVVEAVKRCYRKTPVFPSYDDKGNCHSFVRRLEEIYKEEKMKCLTCPHKGFDLRGEPVRDGKVICPGHGLRWRVKGGRLSPRIIKS